MVKFLYKCNFLCSRLCCLFLLSICLEGYAQTDKTEWLSQLNSEIEQSRKYDAHKLLRIDSLRLQLSSSNKKPFDKYLDLYNEFSVFNFDSAYFYAVKLIDIASASKDTLLIKYAKIKADFVLLSSGMFKEVFDSLNYLNPHGLNNSRKSEYFILKARSYFDLADYNQEKVFTDLYTSEGDRCIDSLLSISSTGTFQFNYYSGLKSIRQGDIRTATTYFRKLNADSLLSLHQVAIVNSTFSDLFIRKGQVDSAVILLCKAAIADIKSSTKETTAILNLATLLFKSGDLKNASAYIQKAFDDARTYGARQRILQLSNILPLIEAARLAAVQSDKVNITRYAFIITALFLLLIVLEVIFDPVMDFLQQPFLFFNHMVE